MGQGHPFILLHVAHEPKQLHNIHLKVIENNALVHSVAADGTPEAKLIFSRKDALRCPIAAMKLLLC